MSVFWSYHITFLMLLLLRKMWRRILNTHCFVIVCFVFLTGQRHLLTEAEATSLMTSEVTLDRHFEIHFCCFQHFSIFVQIQYMYVLKIWNWQLRVERYLKKEHHLGSSFLVWNSALLIFVMKVDPKMQNRKFQNVELKNP